MDTPVLGGIGLANFNWTSPNISPGKNRTIQNINTEQNQTSPEAQVSNDMNNKFSIQD